MLHLQRMSDYFFLNCIVFIINILIGCITNNALLIITSSFALAISLYIYGEDYSQKDVWYLDQIAVLSVIIPGFVAWLNMSPHQQPIAGGFFILAITLYCIGISSGTYNHSTSVQEREKWHLITHLLSTIGHQLITYEAALLPMFGLK